VTTTEVAALVAAAEAEGATLAPSATAGRVRVEWPSTEVADRYRPQVLRHRAAVLSVLTWPRCGRCPHRVPPAHSFCPPHLEELLEEFPAEPTPPEPAPLDPDGEVIALAAANARARGGHTIRRADLTAAELELGRRVPVAQPTHRPGAPRP
jgi:hypothetical protein